MIEMRSSLLLVLILPIVLECSRQNKANNYGLGPINNLSILEKHNLARRMVAQGEIKGQPAAESIPELQWSIRLEEEAKHWAWQCIDAEEPDSESGEVRGYSEQEDYDVFVDWFGEHKNYTYGLFPRSRKRSITRYTQIVWAETEEVGCNTYFCYSFQKADGSYLQEVDYTVCKYSPAGNVVGEPPYEIPEEDNF